MSQDVEQSEYRRGILANGMRPEELPAQIRGLAETLPDVRTAVKAANLFNLGGGDGD